MDMGFLRRRLGRWREDLSMINRMGGKKSGRRCDRIIPAHSRRGRCGEWGGCLKRRRVKCLKVYGRTTSSWDNLLGKSKRSASGWNGRAVVLQGLILAGGILLFSVGFGGLL